MASFASLSSHEALPIPGGLCLSQLHLRTACVAVLHEGKEVRSRNKSRSRCMSEASEQVKPLPICILWDMTTSKVRASHRIMRLLQTGRLVIHA